jgi:hypothetical protein
MNYLSIALGLIAIGYGVAAFAQQLSPANRATLQVIKKTGDTPSLARHITGIVAATVTPIAIGISFVVLGLMGRGLFPFSLFGW